MACKPWPGWPRSSRRNPPRSGRFPCRGPTCTAIRPTAKRASVGGDIRNHSEETTCRCAQIAYPVEPRRRATLRTAQECRFDRSADPSQKVPSGSPWRVKGLTQALLFTSL